MGSFFFYTCKTFYLLLSPRVKDHLTNNLNIRHKILCLGLSKRLPSITDYGYCCWFPQRRCKVSSYSRRHHAIRSQSPKAHDLELIWKPPPPWGLASMIPVGGTQASKRWKKPTVLTDVTHLNHNSQRVNRTLRVLLVSCIFSDNQQLPNSM